MSQVPDKTESCHYSHKSITSLCLSEKRGHHRVHRITSIMRDDSSQDHNVPSQQ